MKHYYMSNRNSENGFDEVTEAEFYGIVGAEEAREYINGLYNETLLISDVPEELREEVQTVVNNRIARFGKYKDQNITSNEFLKMVLEVL